MRDFEEDNHFQLPGYRKSYLERTLNQVILGDFSGDVTGAGTAAQALLGLTGLDIAADIRDISHNLINWEWTWKHAGNFGLNVVALAPGLGVIKSADEAIGLAKAASKGVTKTGGGEGDDVTKWIWSQNKGAAKSIRQMDRRGWKPAQVTEAIKDGQQFPAKNMVNAGNPAIRYVHPQSGQSVVQDTVTKEIIHFGGPGFKYLTCAQFILRLLDEGTEVSIDLHKQSYLMKGFSKCSLRPITTPEDEHWEFLPGTVVRGVRRVLEAEEVLVATRLH